MWAQMDRTCERFVLVNCRNNQIFKCISRLVVHLNRLLILFRMLLVDANEPYKSAQLSAGKCQTCKAFDCQLFSYRNQSYD